MATWTPLIPRTDDHHPPAAGGGYLADHFFVLAPDDGCLRYIRSPQFHQFGETWVLKGDTWTKVTEAIGVEAGQLWTGHTDTGRAASRPGASSSYVQNVFTAPSACFSATG